MMSFSGATLNPKKKALSMSHIVTSAYQFTINK